MRTVITVCEKNLLFKLVFSCLSLLVVFILIVQIYGEPEKEYSDNKFNPKLNLLATSINNLSFPQQNIDNPIGKDVNSDIEKAVIIMFDRGYDTQFTNAKPILDKYGFKASFFVICSFIDRKGYYDLSKGKEFFRSNVDLEPMKWNEIEILDDEGHDVQSHGMEHRYFRNLSLDGIENEIEGSKQCIEEQGMKPTFFQVPFNRGADNSTILNMISKHFDFALSGHSELMFLNCDGWQYGFKTRSYKNQQDCNPFSADGTPTRTHKYAIKEWSQDRFHEKMNDSNPLLKPHGDEISNMVFTEFVRIVEAQNLYNSKAGKIVAVPIIGYHSIGDSRPFDTSTELFDREMKYLYTNGFKVLKMTDLGYNEKENHFYIK